MKHVSHPFAVRASQDVMSGCVAEGTEGARLVAHLKEWRAKMDAVLDEMTCGRLAREKHLREQTQHVVETEEGLVLLTTGARC